MRVCGHGTLLAPFAQHAIDIFCKSHCLRPASHQTLFYWNTVLCFAETELWNNCRQNAAEEQTSLLRFSRSRSGGDQPPWWYAKNSGYAPTPNIYAPVQKNMHIDHIYYKNCKYAPWRRLETAGNPPARIEDMQNMQRICNICKGAYCAYTAYIAYFAYICKICSIFCKYYTFSCIACIFA